MGYSASFVFDFDGDQPMIYSSTGRQASVPPEVMDQIEDSVDAIELLSKFAEKKGLHLPLHASCSESLTLLSAA